MIEQELAQADTGLPVGLERGQHVLRQRHTPWPRRVAITLLAAFAGLGIANVFGQVAKVTTVDATPASLTVDSPEHLRGGLIYTAVFTVVAHRPLQDARLHLDTGWFSGVTFNGSAPQAQSEVSDADGVLFDYGQLDAGVDMPIWISYQMNPTTIGARDQDVSLYDGTTLIATVHRRAVVFP